MSVISKQIGWSNESNLLYAILKQLDRLVQVSGSLTTTTTTTNPPTTTTTTT
jgi:hypothetical protein